MDRLNLQYFPPGVPIDEPGDPSDPNPNPYPVQDPPLDESGPADPVPEPHPTPPEPIPERPPDVNF